jgi:hypothetical protein
MIALSCGSESMVHYRKVGILSHPDMQRFLTTIESGDTNTAIALFRRLRNQGFYDCDTLQKPGQQIVPPDPREPNLHWKVDGARLGN